MADRGRIAAALEYLSSNPVVQAMKGFGSAQGEQMQQMQDAFLSANPITRPFVAGTERDVLGNTFRGGQQIGQSLVNDPGALANALKGEFADAVKGIQSPYGAGRVVGNLFSPMEVASGLKSLAKPVMQEITAYHGTPHRFPATEANPLGEFDASKIGTGEGAQAYGHGLYLAESPDVAEGYRVGLSYDPDQMRVGGRQINDVYDSISNAAARMPAAKASAEYEKLELLERLMMNHSLDDVAKNAAEMSPATAKWFEKQVKPSFQTYGNLYHVDLPDPMIEKMLDWDKPLSEQPHIQRALLNQDEAWKAYANKLSPENRKLAENMVLGNEPVFGDIADKHWNKLQKANPELDHNQIHDTRYLINPKTDDQDWLMSVLSGNAAPGAGVRGGGGADLYNSFGGGAKASEALRQLGIPGIRYLDAGSRDVGNGTRNFVIFPGEEKNLKILERK